MELFEKLARGAFMVLAAALFGWVFALLALESAWRRWRTAGRRRSAPDAAFEARPSLRPTRELQTRRIASW